MFQTYAQEMKAKYPDRPWITRPTWELRNMKKALSIASILNTEEENQRLLEVTRELRLRSKGVK